MRVGLALWCTLATNSSKSVLPNCLNVHSTCSVLLPSDHRPCVPHLTWQTYKMSAATGLPAVCIAICCWATPITRQSLGTPLSQQDPALRCVSVISQPSKSSQVLALYSPGSTTSSSHCLSHFLLIWRVTVTAHLCPVCWELCIQIHALKSSSYFRWQRWKFSAAGRNKLDG